MRHLGSSFRPVIAATFSSAAFVKVAVWRMSSDEAPILTV